MVSTSHWASNTGLNSTPFSAEASAWICPEYSWSATQILDLSTFSFQAIVRTLTASALCAWVFESDLQCICEMPCALLNEYRVLLAKRGTWHHSRIHARLLISDR